MSKLYLIIIAFLLALALILPGCASTKEQGDPVSTGEVTDGTHKECYIDMSDYTVVYTRGSAAALKESVEVFCSALGGLDSDSTAIETRKEIVISEDEATEVFDHEWRIETSENKIEITGSDNIAIKYAMKKFLNLCEGSKLNCEAAKRLAGGFGNEVRVFDNLVIMELKSATLIDMPDKSKKTATLKYPTMIELCHQSDESKNGILLATGERWLDDNNCRIYRSTDKGESFETIAVVKDDLHKGTRTSYAPCLFELPRAVGDMPAGTIILGSDCINDGWTKVYIVLFKSLDQGETWEAFAEIAGGPKDNGGVWEPSFIVTDDGTLVCYYSDERDPAHSQKLVYRASKDGVKWDKAVDIVSLSNGGLRPGMPVVTRMADGRYIMVYEIVGLAGNPVYYKISEDGLDWGSPASMGKKVSAGSDSLAATPWISYCPEIGGENGMLMLTGWRMSSGSSNTGSDIFFSFDSAKSWISVDNYYSYKWNSDDDTWGYSVCSLLSSDGHTLYYMANPQNGSIKNTYTLFIINVE
ncbi:MAG: exo-alpha-sialidase [Clostridia bacterium]|nr:exo-alpha-sialidase [Clostridia bacterium]